MPDTKENHDELTEPQESAKDAAKPDETDAADEAAPESEGDNNPEAVDMPVAKKAITADSAAKKSE